MQKGRWGKWLAGQSDGTGGARSNCAPRDWRLPSSQAAMTPLTRFYQIMVRAYTGGSLRDVG